MLFAGKMNNDEFFDWLNPKGLTHEQEFSRERLLSECAEITVDTFDYFLNVMPPMNWTHQGFAICEATTDELRLGFFCFPISGRFFAAYVSDRDPARSMCATRELIVALCIEQA
jgi:hypothetical protein